MARQRPVENYAHQNFFRQLSTRSALVFYLGVFLLFAPLPLLIASRIHPARELWLVVFWLCFSGLTSVAWAASRTVYKPLLPVAIVMTICISLSWAFQWPRFLAPPMAIPGLDGAGVAGILIAAYILFVVFISGEGLRTLRMQAELTLARRIHEALAPPIRRTAGAVTVLARSDASAEMGGDLIDMVERPGGGIDVFLADVSGHGVKAGVVMGMVKSAIRMRLLDPNRAGDSLGALLTDLSRVVCQVGTPEMFVTFACLRIDGANVSYALAGHPPILRLDAQGRITRLENRHLPLGVHDEAEYDSEELQCATGDTFVLYTDGLTEVADASGTQLGQAGFERIAASAAAPSLEAMFDGIFDRAREHAQGGAQADDQTLMLVRIEPRVP